MAGENARDDIRAFAHVCCGGGGVSRRDFLGGLSAVTALGSLSGAAGPQRRTPDAVRAVNNLPADALTFPVRSGRTGQLHHPKGTL